MSLITYSSAAVDVSAIAGNDSAIGFNYSVARSLILEASLVISGNGYTLESDNIEQPLAWTLGDCQGCVTVPDCWLIPFNTGLLQYQIKLKIQNTPEPYTITVQNGLFIRR